MLETTFKTDLFRITLHCNDIQDFVYDGTMFYYLPAKFQITAFLKVGDEMRRGESDQLSIGNVRTRNKSESFDAKRSEVGYHGEDTCRSNDQDTNLRGQTKELK